MAKVIEYLEIKWPKTINVVTLLKRKNTPFKLDNYEVDGTEAHGFEIDNEWVAGMGMDNDKVYKRNYPSVW